MRGLSRQRGDQLRSEAGVMIVELMVTAMVVGLISVGIFTGLRGASHGSAMTRDRSIAVTLAQQDQERMRAYKATDLSNYSASSPYAVAGVTYTVASRARWVSDSSGVVSCTSGSAQGDYLNITSTVTWTNMGGLQPVVAQSLIAPSPGSFAAGQGAITILIKDRLNAGISGIPVNLSAPANLTDTTDTNGCAVFGGQSAGNYQATFSQPGYVDNTGTNAVNKTVSVIAGTTNPVSIPYDRAGQINVSFDTRVGAVTQAAQARGVRVEHSELQPDQKENYGGSNPIVSGINATLLFPFTSAYGVFAGTCDSNDPGDYGDTRASVIVTPGGTPPNTATVRVPAINIQVRGSSGSPPNGPLTGADVVLTPTGSGCGSAYAKQDTNALGALPAPGFPYGAYSVCADRDDINRRETQTINNNDTLGTATVTFTITSSDSSGDC